MIPTESEILKEVKDDPILLAFSEFVFYNKSSIIKDRLSDENDLSIKLLNSVVNNDRESAEKHYQHISKRQVNKYTPWINNDLLFISITITCIVFNLDIKFLKLIISKRYEVSPEGMHKDLTNAVETSATKTPIFNQNTAIYSIILSNYLKEYTITSTDAITTYKSIMSLNWALNTEPIILKIICVKAFSIVIENIETLYDRGKIHNLYQFAQKYPKMISKLALGISVTISAIVIIIFIKAILLVDDKKQFWENAANIYIILFGAFLAILPWIPKIQSMLRRQLLKISGYPESE